MDGARTQITKLSDVIKQAETLRSDGDFDSACTILNKAQQEYPRNSALLLAKAQVLSDQGQHDQVLDLLSRVIRNRIPLHCFAKAVELLKKHAPDLATSKDMIDGIARADLPDHAKHDLLAPLLEDGDAEKRASLLAHAADVTKLHRYEWKHANRLIENSDWRTALNLLQSAANEGRSSPLSASVLAELLSVAGRNDEAVELIRTEMKKTPDRVDSARKLIKFLQRDARFCEAGTAMEQALATWPDDWMLLMRLNRLPLLEKHRQSCAAMVAKIEKDDPRFRFQQVITALFNGQIEPARKMEIDDFPSSLTGIVEQISNVLRSRPADFWAKAIRHGADETNDVQIVEKPGAKSVVIVPTSITFGLLPIRVLDAVLEEHDCSVIYLKDFNKRMYMRGVRSFGDTLDHTISALNKICDGLGATNKIYLGCSSGGFAAHRMAALSGAQAAVSFAGQADLRTVFSDTKAAVWNEEFLMQQIVNSEPDLDLNNIPFLQRATGTRFIQYYGETWPGDVEQAALFSQVENMELVADPESDHLIVNRFLADGRFDQVLSELIG